MRRSSLGILFATVLLACSADTITDDLSSYGGDYTLRSVNGFPLPYAIQKTTAITLEILDETFSLTSSGSFVDITHYRRTQNPIVDFPGDTLRGTYTVRGQTANFTTTAGDVFSGTMGTGQFSIEGTSAVLLYQR
ncbi:MAG: hypothetical protein M3Z05_23425 [Gemmatimonadota bacterium]|nr:hypothetical protein [Gemmatimonadota bacterium]